MAYYVVHPGYVTLKDEYGFPISDPTYIDAGTLAAYYGLSPGEYDINTPEQEESQDGNIIHIHLFPRTDGKYKPVIPLEVPHLDKPVNWKKKQQERRKYI